MAKRIPKFPLLMENGAKVRNLDELRENADVKSIVRYFQSGQLKRWCMAFGFDDLPDEIHKLTITTITEIYNLLDIPHNDEEIAKYAEEYGFQSGTVRLSCDAPEETEVVNNEDVINVLRNYVDKEIILEDHAIEVMPIQDETGKLCKNKITVTNNKTEQYTSFILPYDVGGSYTKQNYLDDMYKKIAFVLRRMYDENGYCQLKNSRYASLNVGDTFEFGNYNGKALKWLVLKKESNNLFAITTDAVCQRRYDRKNKNWENSELREWLNGEFYSQAFTAGETGFIGSVGNDKVTLLTTDEANKLMTEKTRNIGSSWWLRSPGANGNLYAAIVSFDGRVGSNGLSGVACADGRVRPALYLQF